MAESVADKRRVSSRIFQGVGGAFAVLLLVALVTFLLLFPWSGVDSEPKSVVVSGSASAQQLVCPTPVLVTGADADDRSHLSVLSQLSLNGGVFGEDETPEPRVLEISGVDVQGPSVFEQPANAGGLLAMSARADLNNYATRGLAIAACAEPQMESWLIGGAGEVGASDILTLANPSQVNSVVSITAFGLEGSFIPAAARQILVPASTVVALPLSSLIASEQRPVLQVTAELAPVVATLQSNTIEGLTPVGLEWIQAAPNPAESVVLPGILLQKLEDSDSADIAVRLLAPLASGTAKLSLIDAAGVIVSEVTVPLEAEIPIDALLSAPGAGRYTVVVASDTQLLAAAKDNWHAPELDDYIWWPSTPALSEETAIAVPSGASLNLFNSGSVTQQLSVNGTTHSLEPLATLSLTGLPSDSVLLSIPDAGAEATGIYASVSTTEAGRAAAFGVRPSLTQQPELLIYPQ